MSAKLGKSGKNQGNGLCLKISGKNQAIQLMLEIIREVSRKTFVFVSSINRFPNMLKETCKKTHYAFFL